MKEHVENGLKLKRDEVSAYLLLALSDRELGRFADAGSVYLEALKMAPDDDRVRLNAGIFYDLYLQQPAEALVHYRHYQDLQKAPNPKVAGWVVAIERSIAAKEAAAVIAPVEEPVPAVAKEPPKSPKAKGGNAKAAAEVKKNVEKK